MLESGEVCAEMKKTELLPNERVLLRRVWETARQAVVSTNGANAKARDAVLDAWFFGASEENIQKAHDGGKLMGEFEVLEIGEGADTIESVVNSGQDGKGMPEPQNN